MRYSDAPARRTELHERLQSEGYVSSAQAAADLGVSEMTVRRDLLRLCEEGLARRVPGGVSLPQARAGSDFQHRSGSAGAEKDEIARAVLRQLEDCDSIALDAGTTVAAVARMLPRGPMVVTHSVPVLLTCTAAPEADVIALGGPYQPATRSFAGPSTRAALEDLAVDVALLSATAVDGRGVYCANPLDADVKQAMAHVADRVLVLADHSKLGQRAPIRFAPLEQVDTLVTDSGATETMLRPLQEMLDDIVVAAATDAATVEVAGGT